MRYDGETNIEPEITLPSGARVYASVYQDVLCLLDTGREIQIIKNDVYIDGVISESLSTLPSEVEAVLEDIWMPASMVH